MKTQIDSPVAIGQRMAICGFGDSWQQAPLSDKRVQVAGLNELYQRIGDRWTEWYEIHDEDSIGLTHRAVGQDAKEVAAHKAWLTQDHGDRTIWMQAKYCDGRFPNARPYPLEDIQRKLAAFTKRPVWKYLTSSIAYALAHAITRGRNERLEIEDESVAVTWIGLFGVDLIGAGEYRHQRPAVEFYAGLAYGLGIEMQIPEECALLSADHMYGYEHPAVEAGPLNKTLLLARRARLTKQLDALSRDVLQAKGALLENQNYLTVLEASVRGVTDLPDSFIDRTPQRKADPDLV